jgi:hypothetical protein
MRGKVKRVTRSVYGVHYGGTSYTERRTSVWAELYDGTDVQIDEDDILSYYDRERFSDRLVSMLNNDLHNEWIDYYEDDSGFYWLDGSIDDYI